MILPFGILYSSQIVKNLVTYLRVYGRRTLVYKKKEEFGFGY